jgi:hypothetical protein
VKIPIATAALLVLLGTTASAYAGQEKGQDEHGQEQKVKPAKQTDRPAQQHRAAPVAHQQAQNEKPADQQRKQQPAHNQQPQTHAANQNRVQANPGRSQEHAQQTHAVAENRAASQHGRISNAHYASSFGSGHRFRVSKGEYASRRFSYGGYSFGFVDPWPVAWGYSDDVYVVYTDGGYYMYDHVHPGLRISVNIL